MKNLICLLKDVTILIVLCIAIFIAPVELSIRLLGFFIQVIIVWSAFKEYIRINKKLGVIEDEIKENNLNFIEKLFKLFKNENSKTSPELSSSFSVDLNFSYNIDEDIDNPSAIKLNEISNNVADIIKEFSDIKEVIDKKIADLIRDNANKINEINKTVKDISYVNSSRKATAYYIAGLTLSSFPQEIYSLLSSLVSFLIRLCSFIIFLIV